MNSQRKRRYFSIILLAVFGLMLFVPAANQAAHAQNQGDVTLTAHAGFGGNCKQNAWIPVRVKVENKGADLNARIQVGYENTKGGKSAHAVDISLPANSRKELFLYLYAANYLGKVSVDVMAGDQIIVTTPLNINCIGSESLIIGSLSSDALSTISVNHDVQATGFVRIAQLQLADLPDQSQGWESLDALVITNTDMGSITDKQRTALKGWLAQGGKLLMTGGPQWQGTINRLDEILPVALSGTKTLHDLSSLQAYAKTAIALDTSTSAIVAIGKLQPKAVVLLEQDGVPLLVQKQFGSGSIYYFAADPSLQPLKNWGGMSILYGYLLGTHTLHPGWADSEWETSSANQALAALPALGLPPTLYVVCLLGIYILIIGPINYLILRRIKRQELAWISIPVFVILFTLVAYFSGFWIRGTRPILNRLAVIQAWDGIDQAEVHGLVGIYAPIRTKYTLQTGGLFLPYPFDSNSQTLQTNQGWLSVLKGTEMLLPDVLVESGGMKSTFLNGSIPAIKLTHNLTMTLSTGNPLLISGSITNNSKYTIKNAMLITADDAKNIGDLAPGAVKRIQAVLSSSPMGSDIYDFQSQSIYYNYQNNQPDDRIIRQNALMRALLPSNQSQLKVTSGIYLTGWVDDALLTTSVDGQAFDSYDTTFYALALSPTLISKPGPITLTPGLFSWESSDPNLGPYMSDYYYGRDIPPGGYSLTFKLAIPIHYSSVKSLKLSLNANNTNSNKPTGIKVSLKDWQSGQWEPIADVTWGTIEIPDPARFVGPEGEVSLRIDPITNATRNFGQITTSYFTLVVEP